MQCTQKWGRLPKVGLGPLWQYQTSRPLAYNSLLIGFLSRLHNVSIVHFRPRRNGSSYNDCSAGRQYSSCRRRCRRRSSLYGLDVWHPVSSLAGAAMLNLLTDTHSLRCPLALKSSPGVPIHLPLMPFVASSSERALQVFTRASKALYSE